MARAGGSRRTGKAKAGYMEIVIAAARQWRLPDRYIASLQRFLPAAGARKLGAFGWT